MGVKFRVRKAKERILKAAQWESVDNAGILNLRIKKIGTRNLTVMERVFPVLNAFFALKMKH